MDKSKKLALYLRVIEKQQSKIRKLDIKREKLLFYYPKALYPESLREMYYKDYLKKEKKIRRVIELTRIKIRGVEAAINKDGELWNKTFNLMN